MALSLASAFCCGGYLKYCLDLEEPDSFHLFESASRLRRLCNSTSPQIAEFIACTKEDSLMGEVICRVFLEHVYAKSISNITRSDIRMLLTHIHPDKKNYSYDEANELFKLHQKFLDVKSASDPAYAQFNTVWLYHKVWGWYYHREINQSHQEEHSV